MKKLDESASVGASIPIEKRIDATKQKDVDVSSETTKDTGGDRQSDSTSSEPRHVWLNGRSGTIAWDGRTQNMEFVTIRWADTGEISDIVRIDDVRFKDDGEPSAAELALLNEVAGPTDFDLEAAVFGDEPTDAFLSPLTGANEAAAVGDGVAMDGCGSESSDVKENSIPLDLEL